MPVRSVRLLCLIAVFTPVLYAQQSEWQNLSQIRQGAKVLVVETSLKTTAGKFVGFSETDLTLMSENKQVVIPKLQVYRVSIIGKNRKRNTLMGVGIGAAAGIGVGVAANRVVSENWVIPGVALAYAGVGAGIGALVPASKTIYRKEVPKQASLKAPAR